MKKSVFPKEQLNLSHFESASLPKPQLKHIKGGNGGNPDTPPDDEPNGFIGSDDVVDG